MKKFSNRIDHFVWICRPENLESHVQRLSQLFRVEFLGPWEHDFGGGDVKVCVSWEGGLELIAPLSEESAMGRILARKGEGPYALVFAVDDLDESIAHAKSLGHAPGDVMETPLDRTPWAHKLGRIREAAVGEMLGTVLVLGEVNYSEGVIEIV